MKTLAHISDLHFGTVNSKVAEGLIEDLNKIKPLMLINSGDFTQRARRSQFRAAAEYIKHLPQPQINVPGNHDIPLFDVLRRFLSPLSRYKNYITDKMIPQYVDEDITVLGINTARSLTWKSGRISKDQIEELERILSALPASRFKIIVTHHPFIPPPGQQDAGVDLVGRAARALEIFERCDVDLLLAGHLHHGYTGDVRTFYPSSNRSIIVAQAGTAISNRIRGEKNGYNIIRLREGRIEIEVRKWNRSGKSFQEASCVVFSQKDGQWLPQPEKDGPGPVS